MYTNQMVQRGKLVLNGGFYKFCLNYQKLSKLFLSIRVCENSAWAFYNLFLISDEKPGWASYKCVSYKKKCMTSMKG